MINASYECYLGCSDRLWVTKAKWAMSGLAMCLCLVVGDVSVNGQPVS